MGLERLTQPHRFDSMVTMMQGLSVLGVIFSGELDFNSLERPSLTGVKSALNSFLYVVPNLSYLRINGASTQTLEVGQALSSPVITWTSNKVEPQAVVSYQLTRPTSQTQTGNYTFSTFNDPTSYNISSLPGVDTQALSSWQIKITDWSNAQYTGTTTAYWRYRVYYGVTSQATPNGSQILSGTQQSQLATTRTGLGVKTITPNNEYFFVAYPSRFGVTSTLKVNGLNYNDFTQQSIVSFTNQFGGTDTYYVYRSNNILNASYTIEIV